MIYKPDFKRAYITATELLVQNAGKEFPFKFKRLIKEFTDIELYTFNQIIELGENPVKICGSELAGLYEKNGEYCIIYNSSAPNEVKRFSLSHELGHYFLSHNMDSNLSVTNPELYGKQEVETNFFSAQLLMPDQLINEAIKRGYRISVPYLMQSFQISETAAQKRIDTLKKRRDFSLSKDERMYDDIILAYYKNFIDRIAPKKQHYFLDDEYEKQRERDSWY